MLHLNRYQWTVLLAAWLGCGFDAFDGLLFNFVALNCVPTLLGLTIGSPEASAPTLYWTGLLTSVLLLGWAAGGVLLGILNDRIRCTKTLLLTILFYSLGAFAIEKERTAHIRELFTPQYRQTTLGGLAIVVVTLLA